MKSVALNVSGTDIYHSIIGSLLYLATTTRPDLRIAASILGLYVVYRAKAHYIGAKRDLRYSKGMLDAELKLCSGMCAQQLAYNGPNWGGKPTQVLEVGLECLFVIETC